MSETRDRRAEGRGVHPRIVPLNLRAGVCVGAAIFHRDTLLLLRRVSDFPGRWELPGGSVEEGETLEVALRREIREETGLAVQVRRPFYAATFEANGQEGRRITVVAIEFLCEALSKGAVQLAPSEHDSFQWVTHEELAGFSLVPGFVPVVPEAFRVHDLRKTRAGAR